MKIIFVFLLCLPVMVFSQTGQVKRAIASLKEGNYEKAKDLLTKAYQKSSEDPFVNYGWSVFYENLERPENNLDTAYFFILQARNNFARLPEKETSKLTKNGIDSLFLEKHKRLLDSLSFEVSKEENTVRSYTAFILKYPTALQLGEAIKLRETAAYKVASEEDTPEAYEIYIRNYPQARETKKAAARLDQLVYKEVSSEGTLESYYTFLRENPETAYREQVEQNILKISTTGNNLSDFLKFLSYGKSELVIDQAKAFLFHILKEEDGTNWESHTWMTDSLFRELDTDQKKLHPIFEKKGYNFVNEDGRIVFPQYFDDLSDQYLCEPLDSDVFLFFDEDIGRINSRSGHEIYQGELTAMEDLGYGVVKTQVNSKVGAIHKSGEKILEIGYDNVRVLGGKYLISKKNNKWGLHSFFGLHVLPHQFDSIDIYGSSIILKKDQRWAITTIAELKKSVNRASPNLVFIYDEVEKLDDEKLWVRSASSEAIIDENSGFGIPLDAYTIEPLKTGYLVTKDSAQSLLGLDFSVLFDDCSAVSHNQTFMSIISGGKNYLYNISSEHVALYDSVKLWGAMYAVASKNDSLWLVFASEKKIVLNKSEALRLVQNHATGFELLQVVKEQASSIYDPEGNLILVEKADKVSLLGKDHIVVENNNRKGLYTISGERLLKNNYETIVLNEDTTITFIQKGKLGLFDPVANIMTKAISERRIKKGVEGQFVIYREGGYEVIDQKSKSIFDESFEEIISWGDSSYLVKLDGLYKIISSYDGESQPGNYGRVDLLFTRNGSEFYKVENSVGDEGVMTPALGEIIIPEFTYISYLEPFIIAEKHIESAGYYVIIYFNDKGEVIWRGGVEEKDYNRIFCEDL